MKRQILFRGKRVDNGEWVEGYLLHTHPEHYSKSVSIATEEYSPVSYGSRMRHDVIPESVGQWSGKLDNKGNKIFEGDINEDRGIVIWNEDEAAFLWEYRDIETMPFENENQWCEVIGNLHDNPELITV